MKEPVFSILAVQERDIYALIELSQKQIIMLRKALERCEISIDKSKEEDVKIEERFMHFYEQLTALEKQLGDRYGSPSDS